MEDVRIYDFEFNLLHIEHDITSCNWTIYENDIGTFEMHFPLTSRLVNVLMGYKYLVAVQGEKQAIITGRQLTTEGVLYGKTCNWILTRFCTSEQFDTDSLYTSGIITSKDAQTVCEYLIDLTMSAADNFIFDKNTEDSFGDVYVENKGISSSSDLVCDCLGKDGAGHTVFFDIPNKKWVFRVSKGKELSVVLSDGNRNAYDTEYSSDMQDYFTGGWYEQEMQDMGDWDAAANSPELANNDPANFAKAYRVITDGTRFGISFIEGDYIACKDKLGTWSKQEHIESFYVHIPSGLEGVYAWETAINGTTEDEAKKYLNGCAIDQTMKAKTRGFIFGQDYQLGDMVTVQIEKGGFRSSLQHKITGVNLWYEDNDIGEQPIMEEKETDET